jgi:hypothetical protein
MFIPNNLDGNTYTEYTYDDQGVMTEFDGNVFWTYALPENPSRFDSVNAHIIVQRISTLDAFLQSDDVYWVIPLIIAIPIVLLIALYYFKSKREIKIKSIDQLWPKYHNK